MQALSVTHMQGAKALSSTHLVALCRKTCFLFTLLMETIWRDFAVFFLPGGNVNSFYLGFLAAQRA